ncbi:hypothetical protein MKX01_030894 [Papaver californicum]|nr:hypothetical protein MKX01_030894 [Papaver californicum]
MPTGRRREMEDAVTVEPGFLSINFIRFDFFAVYDGHGGSKVAQACRNRLYQVLAKEIEDIERQLIELNLNDNPIPNKNWIMMMVNVIMKMNLIGKSNTTNGSGSGSGSSMKTVGSTAVVAILSKDKLVVANCGDSRAVLSRAGIAIPLSRYIYLYSFVLYLVTVCSILNQFFIKLRLGTKLSKNRNRIKSLEGLAKN